MEESSTVPARLWAGNLGEGDVEIEDKPVAVEVECEQPNEVMLHTFIDGKGSFVSYYFDRESVITLAANLLKAVRLDG